MSRPCLLIYDDGRGRFGPMTDRRAALSLRTGVHTSRQRIEIVLDQQATDLHVPPALVGPLRLRETVALVNQPLRRDGADTQVLLVNGRWSGGPQLDPDAVRHLPPGHVLTQADGQMIAARLPVDAAQALVDSNASAFPEGLQIQRLSYDVLLSRPWHILDQLEATLAADLTRIQPPVHPDAQVHRTAVIDESAGPVVIADGASIGALSILEGPCYIGAASTVMPRSLIRRNTVVGEHCKVAGEISFSILHSHTNKAHEGFLGHSLVGQWVNLGAGTNVSNLKNTYGHVQVQLDRKGPPEDTGRTFLGPVIGDFVRTAIGTRLTTGSVIGTGAMIALSGIAPKIIARLAFLTDHGSMATEIDKLIATARAMMARRDVELTGEDESLLRALADSS